MTCAVGGGGFGWFGEALEALWMREVIHHVIGAILYAKSNNKARPREPTTQPPSPPLVTPSSQPKRTSPTSRVLCPICSDLISAGIRTYDAGEAP